MNTCFPNLLFCIKKEFRSQEDLGFGTPVLSFFPKMIHAAASGLMNYIEIFLSHPGCHLLYYYMNSVNL
jgi:hypothetical protein